ncbi:hypothetical protein ElyMa_002349300 [Elysia marginata]|uniref:Homeobox domain-containing protein n=1 Tax=Elysia marginata TaxID=1093978 RepID=A0AAV4GAX4_9GAST|nr:hypothetical protein ElyMa_002349300 [Elysia marginata]
MLYRAVERTKVGLSRPGRRGQVLRPPPGIKWLSAVTEPRPVAWQHYTAMFFQPLHHHMKPPKFQNSMRQNEIARTLDVTRQTKFSNKPLNFLSSRGHYSGTANNSLPYTSSCRKLSCYHGGKRPFSSRY